MVGGARGDASTTQVPANLTAGTVEHALQIGDTRRILAQHHLPNHLLDIGIA